MSTTPQNDPTLPFAWQHLYDWYTSRHYQPAEAYTQADKLWKTLAPLILDEMTDAEVEQFTDALIAEHGEYNGEPDITDRQFPRCLYTRLNLIARRKTFAKQHQGQSYRLADFACMVSLHVKEISDGEWKWQVIHDHSIDTFGTAKSEIAAWAKVEEQWEISRPRLRQQGGAQ